MMRRRKRGKCQEEKEKKKYKLVPCGSDNERSNFLLYVKKISESLHTCTGRLPDATFPSDHLSIKANFAFVPSP